MFDFTLEKIKIDLLLTFKAKDTKTILCTSSHVGEGTTTAAICVARSLSCETKSKILLVDSNFRSPCIHEIFNLPQSPGLADLLEGREDTHSVIQESKDKLISIMTSGSIPEKPLGLFRTNRFKDVLEELKNSFDYVVFDIAPVLLFSDASLVAGHFDGMVLVIECEKTRYEVVSTALEALRKTDAIILGIILNKRRYYIPEGIYKRLR